MYKPDMDLLCTPRARKTVLGTGMEPFLWMAQGRWWRAMDDRRPAMPAKGHGYSIFQQPANAAGVSSPEDAQIH